jgi:predicted TIM-barrel fold metal-dependent hydrolase
MIIDAHLHVWRSDPVFPDQTLTTVSPASDVPLALLEQYMEEHGVDRAVIVQPLYPGEDNSFVADCAASNPDKFAAVCVVDPRKPDAASRLEFWVGEHHCRGLRLRPGVPGEADCFAAPATFPIWEFAQQAKVVISILGGFAYLGAVAELAKRFRDVPIIIDHLAHPPELALSACEPLLSLADCSNVLLKISGFPYYSRQGYPYHDCQPLVRAIYDRFGPERMVWGSDFPHVLLQSGYARALHWLQRTCDFLDARDIELILGSNARRLYWAT